MVSGEAPPRSEPQHGRCAATGSRPSLPSRREAEHSGPLVSSPGDDPPKFTAVQGQYLAFIHAYAKLHRRAPAEADLRRFFGVTAPSVHRMVVALETRGLIRREPGKARSITLLVAPEQLPILR